MNFGAKKKHFFVGSTSELLLMLKIQVRYCKVFTKLFKILSVNLVVFDLIFFVYVLHLKTAMGETFLININCSKILVDNDETQYTMFIDRAKMSIVFELIEWIRWMFSVDNCIYLMHENSVIHELEDIQVLSRLKNFEIKPCGRFQCVHKKTYRTLLNNCNMFVLWNETKIHKYFLDKINQISQKLSMESKEHLKITNKENGQNESSETNKNKTFCSGSEHLKKQLEKSGLGDSPLNKKKASFDNYEFKIRPNSKSSHDINMGLNNPLKSEEDNIKHFEDSICFKDSYHLSSKNFAPENNKSLSPVSVNSSLKNELIKPETSKNIAKSKTGKYFTKFRPFSLGEVLSNIREDFEKGQKETALLQKNIPSDSLMCEGENFDEKMSVTEDIFVEDNQTESKKRQRTRRRKRSKAKSSENTDIAFDLFQVAPTFKSPKSSCNLKPSHIRFDINDENNLAEAECFESKLNENKLEMYLKTEPKKLVTPLENNCQSLLDSPLISSVVNDIESEMKCLEDVDPKNNEEKLIDLDNPDCDNSSLTKDFGQRSVGQDFTMLDSLKEKFKNSVVIERFY